MERTDAELIAAVRGGDSASFETLIQRHSPRVFSTARRYARRDDEVEDVVQEVWLKAYQKLCTFRGDAPFEHWLMRLAVRTSYDFRQAHQRNRESCFSGTVRLGRGLADRFRGDPDNASEHADAASSRFAACWTCSIAACADGDYVVGN